MSFPLKKPKGFQKGHPFYKGGEKGWFTSERMKGNTNGFKKGDKRIKEISQRPERRKKLSVARRKLLETGWRPPSGEQHHNWKGGKSYEEYPKAFFEIREKILERDNFVCQLCKKQIMEQTKKLFISVHHIDYDKKNNKQDNLIALCNFCNSRVNYNRKNWSKFFKEVSR